MEIGWTISYCFPVGEILLEYTKLLSSTDFKGSDKTSVFLPLTATVISTVETFQLTTGILLPRNCHHSQVSTWIKNCWHKHKPEKPSVMLLRKEVQGRHRHLTHRPMKVIRLQPRPEQAGHTEPATSRQKEHAILLPHATPCLATLIPLPHRNLYPKLKKPERTV